MTPKKRFHGSRSSGGGVVEEGRSNFDIDLEEPVYDPEEDDEPDTTDGLTFPQAEMDPVLQRVSDGKISDQERAAPAAMLILGMAGGAGEFSSLKFTALSLYIHTHFDPGHQARDVHSRSLR